MLYESNIKQEVRLPAKKNATRERLILCVNAILQKKAKEIVILNLKEVSAFTDYMIICSGTSEREVQAIAGAIQLFLKKLLEEISRSSKASYNAFDKKLDRAGLKMRVKQIRSYYATTMRELGLLSEQIDLVQGRIGKGIFLQHYFKANPKPLSQNILLLQPDLEKSLQD